MYKIIEKTYQKGEMTFAIVWIVVYCVVNSLANQLSGMLGIDNSVTFVCNLLLSLALLQWVRRKGLSKTYGLCRTTVPAARFLWYLPLALLVSHNLWYGVSMNQPVADTVFYIGSMLCVGFLEELIFRGFLFRALARDNVKTAMIVSSVTFGIGHLINLVNGSGMELAENLCQVAGAIAIGFLFVVLFHRGRSLLPCILAHGLINSFSTFSNEAGIVAGGRMLFLATTIVIALGYALVLMKTLPEPEQETR